MEKISMKEIYFLGVYSLGGNIIKEDNYLQEFLFILFFVVFFGFILFGVSVFDWIVKYEMCSFKIQLELMFFFSQLV